MTHVTITIMNEEGEGIPFVRSKDYDSKAEVCADAADIMGYITDHVR